MRRQRNVLHTNEQNKTSEKDFNKPDMLSINKHFKIMVIRMIPNWRE